MVFVENIGHKYDFEGVGGVVCDKVYGWGWSRSMGASNAPHDAPVTPDTPQDDFEEVGWSVIGSEGGEGSPDPWEASQGASNAPHDT